MFGLRGRLVVALCVCAVAFAGGCSSGGSTQGANTTTPATVATNSSADVIAPAFPVTIEHKFGTTTIPAAPTRVVSLGYTEQDAILALGVVPVAVRYAFGPQDDVFFPWADEAAGAAQPVIMGRSEINYEQIASVKPDLIMAVTAGLQQADYQRLSEIAPVVVQPKEYVDFGTPWQVQTQVTGEALGQPERAAGLIAEVESQFAEARSGNPGLANVSLVLSGPMYDGQYPFHASDDTRTRFFGDLGMVVPAELDAIAGDEFYGTVSREQADLFNADVLIWQAGSAQERADIEADVMLSALPVVVDGRGLFLEGSDYDALQFSSALSLPYLLENFVPKLADVAPGT